MPYGVPKTHGGDTPENDKKMEDCVSSIMKKQGIPKPQAIAICKDSLFGKGK